MNDTKTSKRQALIDKLLAERGLQRQAKPLDDAGPPLEPRPEGSPIELSPGQERLFVLQRLDPLGAVYNMPVVTELRGELDVEAFESALRWLVARHEVLRTKYELRDGEATAIFEPDAKIEVRRHDLSETPAEERDAVLDEWLHKETSRPLPLTIAPLMRATIVNLGRDEGEDHHLLLVVVHHIACDQWSLGILQAELFAAYDAIRRGAEPDLAVPKLQFADYAAWQRRCIEAGITKPQIEWWCERLQDAPRSLALPYDHARPKHFGLRGERTRLDLGDAQRAGLEELARRHSATPFMVWMAAWSALLASTTGQPRVVVGTPIAGRQRPEMATLVGFVANTIVLDVEANPSWSFERLLDSVKRTALEAYAHQDASFDEVVTALNPVRKAGVTPLFNVMMVFDDAARPASFESLTVRPRDVGYGSARFDLTLVVTPHPTTTAFIEYAVELFDRSTADAMARRLSQLLRDVVEDPSRPLGELLGVDEAERDHLLSLAGSTQPLPAQTVLDQFAAQVAAAPDAVALSRGKQTMTYGQLDVRRRSLAKAVESRGLKPNERVALLLDRTFDAIASVLAVMTVGAAYVPIDPRAPRIRIEGIIGDAGARLLLTDRRSSGLVPVGDHGPIVPFIVLDELDDDPSAAPSSSPPTVGDLAYIVFTSGSTGTPKGAMVSHGSLASTIAGLVAYLKPTPADRVLQFVSLGFDVAASEIFQALATGATLVMAEREDLVPGPGLVSLLRQEEISIVSMPASVLAASPFEPLGALRALIVGGEVCPPSVVEQWSEGRQMFNCYGPTETTITATTAEAARGAFSGIGTALPGVRCYILDDSLRLAPRGVVGELAIGGSGVGWGYIGRPGLTAERFVPDPFSPNEGDRLYLTGDRARWRADGSIEFAGRSDEQVKIRGHRVEPAEVESVITSHPDVTEAAVVPDRQHDELVAYVVGSKAQLDLEELRDFVRARLPEYMVPGPMMALDALPRTSSDKLDRRNLPEPQRTRRHVQHRAPRDEIETTLCAIWERVLDIDRAGVDDDFFDVGGNSFSIMKLLTQIEMEFGCRLPHGIVFERGTIAEMANLIRDRRDRRGDDATIRLRKGKDGFPVYCVHPVGGNVLCYGMLSRLLDSAHPVFGLRARGAETSRKKSPALEPRSDLVEMAEAYADTIVAQHADGPIGLLGWSFGATVAYEVAGRLKERGREVPVLALLDGTAPWAIFRDIEEAGLMAQLLYDLSGMFGVTPPSYDQLRQVGAEELEQMAVTYVKGIQLFKPGTELAEVRRHVSMYRAHMNAHLHYQPRSYDGDVLYVAAEGSSYRTEARERWMSLIQGEFHEVPVDARHADLLRKPHVSFVASAINEQLGKAGGNHAHREGATPDAAVDG